LERKDKKRKSTQSSRERKRQGQGEGEEVLNVEVSVVRLRYSKLPALNKYRDAPTLFISLFIFQPYPIQQRPRYSSAHDAHHKHEYEHIKPHVAVGRDGVFQPIRQNVSPAVACIFVSVLIKLPIGICIRNNVGK